MMLNPLEKNQLGGYITFALKKVSLQEKNWSKMAQLTSSRQRFKSKSF